MLDKLINSVCRALGFSLDLDRVSMVQVSVTFNHTEPSDLLDTKPVTPRLLACLEVKDLEDVLRMVVGATKRGRGSLEIVPEVNTCQGQHRPTVFWGLRHDNRN